VSSLVGDAAVKTEESEKEQDKSEEGNVVIVSPDEQLNRPTHGGQLDWFPGAQRPPQYPQCQSFHC
jgi:hypothetical protein